MVFLKIANYSLSNYGLPRLDFVKARNDGFLVNFRLYFGIFLQIFQQIFIVFSQKNPKSKSLCKALFVAKTFRQTPAKPHHSSLKNSLTSTSRTSAISSRCVSEKCAPR